MTEPIPRRPFSDNIVFVDAEFTSLDPSGGEILSLALIRQDDSELYLELEVPDDVSVDPWVTEHVIPFLSGEKISREEACERIREFVGDGTPYLIAYVNQFDAVFLHKLFGLNRWPFHWLPIDFASILFSFGLDPEKLFDSDKAFSRAQGVPRSGEHRTHHALSDARLLRDIYRKLPGLR